MLEIKGLTGWILETVGKTGCNTYHQIYDMPHQHHQSYKDQCHILTYTEHSEQLRIRKVCIEKPSFQWMRPLKYQSSSYQKNHRHKNCHMDIACNYRHYHPCG